MGCESVTVYREAKTANFMIVFLAVCGNPGQDYLWSSFPHPYPPSFSLSKLQLLHTSLSLYSSEEAKQS